MNLVRMLTVCDEYAYLVFVQLFRDFCRELKIADLLVGVSCDTNDSDRRKRIELSHYVMLREAFKTCRLDIRVRHACDRCCHHGEDS